jgi:hypothetical protein
MSVGRRCPSSGAGNFAHMFDQLVAAAAGASGASAVGAWARVENAACAQQLSAIADVLEARLAADGSDEREQWCIDNWDAVAAEVPPDNVEGPQTSWIEYAAIQGCSA